MNTKWIKQVGKFVWGCGIWGTVWGCSMLDVEPTSVITSNSFWTSEADAEGALAGMYVQLRNNAVENLFIWKQAPIFVKS